jgi:hypothetical protein
MKISDSEKDWYMNFYESSIPRANVKYSDSGSTGYSKIG